MARAKMNLCGGIRISDYLSLGMMANIIPMPTVKSVLEECDKQTVRQRKLPCELIMYYVICLPLYSNVALREVLRCLLEGLSWLNFIEFKNILAGKSGISQARKKLGEKALKILFEKICKPIAVKATKGAWYKNWLLVAIDGSTLDLPDEKDNNEEFGRPGSSRGKSAFPKLRFVALLEIGTRIIFSAAKGKYKDHELTLAKKVLSGLSKGMLCLADRGFLNFNFYPSALKTGADLLFRAKTGQIFKCEKRFKDGSFLSKIYPSSYDRKTDRNGIQVRVVEYTLKGVAESEERYVLVTSILDPKAAPAKELAALYHERWEIEIAYDEVKTHLKEPGECLRSKKPELVKQEFWGYLLAHFVIRSIMYQAAGKKEKDPDELSFVHAVRVIRRKIISHSVFSLQG